MVAALGLVGCSDLGEPLRLAPHAELSATSLDFGTVVVSGTATRSVVVGNSGTGDLNGFATVGCPDYSIQSGGGAFRVAPGAQHSVVVLYHPTSEGASPCQLQLGADIPVVVLMGTGAPQPAGGQCVLSVASLDFGATAVGSSKAASYKIRNPGSAATTLNVVPTCGDFVITSGGGPSTLPPGDSLVVAVQFSPQAGGPISCSIAHGPGCPDLAVNGTGTTVSFAAEIAPIFASLSQTRGCANCHVFRTRDDVVNVPAGAFAPAVYIEPFDLMNSVIYQRITNSGRFGAAMPQGTQGLPAPDREKFRRWIVEGALDN